MSAGSVKNARPAGRSDVFHRFPRNDMATAAGGEGPYIFDTSGKRYIDGSSGAAVSSLGHGHPRIAEAMKRQIDHITFAHTSFFTSEPAEELASLLTDLAPGDLSKVYFTSGGSESVEAALKLARQYYVEKGETSRHRIISRAQSYHGNTLGALAAGGNLWRREAYTPLLLETIQTPAVYPYREKQDSETDEAYGRRVADELEAAILREGPENVMCFIVETVAGATIGTVPPPPGYFARIREICDKYGVLLILDEVMCGMGRTGTLFAFEQENIAADIVTLAKGLGAGYASIGATITTTKIYDTIVSGSGFFQHGHTYTGHPLACATALEAQKLIAEEDLLSNVRKQAANLEAALQSRFGQHPNVGDIRGRGLFQSLEFVSDRESKAPLDPSLKFASKLKAAGLAEGLLCYPMGGVIDGRSGDHAMLAPPFIVNESHIEEIVDKLDRAIDAALGAARQ
ncbi:aspartate aminotransferase family protein [Hoeflea sp. WL0058]|uniref:Aspartate aminotransferase family protein n=1 Tax=Flavimaribacter sediminis TaxID=2865987 RepID=A0AAE2ZQ21_9HYPH|nr:aspartate aminotransferase family protein [Flavimaribacter sediminis]MBW8637517.1 aspartate aminotransferase family protein [Flavimaribacter sediminis]